MKAKTFLQGSPYPTAILHKLKAGPHKACITNFGARLVAWTAPDINKEKVDIVLGYDTIAAYDADRSHFHGCTVGRFANRIREAKFIIGNKIYQIDKLLPTASLHSAPEGFDRKVWSVVSKNKKSIVMEYNSSDGEGGFPGNLSVQISYTLSKKGKLELNYSAKTDADTVINLTNHSYFSLDGKCQTLENTWLSILSDETTEIDDTCTPIGTYFKVKDTALDFNIAKPISRDIDSHETQMKYGSGYDHNFVLKKGNSNKLIKAAEAYHAENGITLEVHTTEPGVQLYTANWLDESLPGKKLNMQRRRGAFCLETQHFADSPNIPHFPSTLLNAGHTFTSTTIYKVGIKKN